MFECHYGTRADDAMSFQQYAPVGGVDVWTNDAFGARLRGVLRRPRDYNGHQRRNI